MARKRKKQRKRTSVDVPAKGRLRDMADQLWSRAVRDDWANQCADCTGRLTLNAHHLIPRQHEATRYDLRNGICLCSYCHQFDSLTSPHQNAAGFMRWLKQCQPELHDWYVEAVDSGKFRRFDGTKNADYYCGVIRGLKEYVEDEDFEKIVGVKFERWLEENE